jgi:hypothetical protein
VLEKERFFRQALDDNKIQLKLPHQKNVAGNWCLKAVRTCSQNCCARNHTNLYLCKIRNAEEMRHDFFLLKLDTQVRKPTDTGQWVFLYRTRGALMWGMELHQCDRNNPNYMPCGHHKFRKVHFTNSRKILLY